jgi:hypothetical protein
MSRTNVIRGNRRDSRLSAGQARLLKQINHGFSDAWWDHYHELVGKRQDCVLSAAEHRKLIQLTDQLENREVKRLRALLKLARLRKQSLAKLMTELGLPGTSNG